MLLLGEAGATTKGGICWFSFLKFTAIDTANTYLVHDSLLIGSWIQLKHHSQTRNK